MEAKFRLLLNNKLVGYEWHKIQKGLQVVIMHSKDSEEWCNFNILPERYIDHDDKDQFIGIKDEDGIEMYARDIVEYFQFSHACPKCNYRKKQINEVKFNALGATLSSYRIIDPQSDISEIRIIGTVHDLKVKHKEMP